MKKLILLVLIFWLLVFSAFWVRKREKPFVVGIVPHDLFASFIIADFFQKLSFQKPKTIILVGPNHSEVGSFKNLTSFYGWQTHFGIVEPNRQIIKELIGQNLAKLDKEILEKEQSVGAIMPFIKYYFPDASVVPLVLSARLTTGEINILAEKLTDYTKDGVVILASIDFSHYLRNREAQEKDKLTLKLMRDFAYNRLLKLDNSYLDSPASLIAILMVAKKLNKTNFEIFYHTNSGELTKNDYTPTTSYFSIAFR